ncbi:MAG TPA: hypothetical protein VNE41_06810 [Chitinophagaceae bacterium]|nr:hypothetical protein [Chitinophagaceae bacterium]
MAKVVYYYRISKSVVGFGHVNATDKITIPSCSNSMHFFVFYMDCKVWHNFYMVEGMKWIITIFIILVSGGVLFPILKHRIFRQDEFDASKDLFI